MLFDKIIISSNELYLNFKFGKINKCYSNRKILYHKHIINNIHIYFTLTYINFDNIKI